MSNGTTVWKLSRRSKNEPSGGGGDERATTTICGLAHPPVPVTPERCVARTPTCCLPACVRPPLSRRGALVARSIYSRWGACTRRQRHENIKMKTTVRTFGFFWIYFGWKAGGAGGLGASPQAAHGAGAIPLVANANTISVSIVVCNRLALRCATGRDGDRVESSSDHGDGRFARARMCTYE